MFLEISQNSQGNTCARVSFNKIAGLRPATLLKKKLGSKTCNFVKKVTLAPVFSFEFSEISKNTFLKEHLLETASAIKMMWSVRLSAIQTHFWNLISRRIKTINSNDLFNCFIKSELSTKCQSGFLPGDSRNSQLFFIAHEINLSHDSTQFWKYSKF